MGQGRGHVDKYIEERGIEIKRKRVLREHIQVVQLSYESGELLSEASINIMSVEVNQVKGRAERKENTLVKGTSVALDGQKSTVRFTVLLLFIITVFKIDFVMVETPNMRSIFSIKF